jgi:hypothetical protein
MSKETDKDKEDNLPVEGRTRPQCWTNNHEQGDEKKTKKTAFKCRDALLQVLDNESCVRRQGEDREECIIVGEGGIYSF